MGGNSYDHDSSTPMACDEFGVPEVFLRQSPNMIMFPGQPLSTETSSLTNSNFTGSANFTNIHNQYNPFGFTGYQVDDISGMYYAQARYYSPTSGRFMAEDPIKDQLNWYGYCEANPLTFVDPTGFAASPHLNDNRTQCDLCSTIGFLNPIVPLFAAFGSTPLGLNAIIGMNVAEMRINPATTQGGIVLMGSLAQRQELLRYLQMLTRDQLSMELLSRGDGPTGFERYFDLYIVRVHARAGTRLNYGTDLIRRLANSPHTVTVRHAGFGRNNIVTLSSCPNRCATVWLDTTNPLGVLVEGSSSTGNRLEDAPTHIILGHELIHALRHFEGNSAWGSGMPLYTDPSGIMRRIDTPREELHTIGIPYQRQIDGPWTFPTGITENALRAEHGLPRRLSWFYCWEI